MLIRFKHCIAAALLQIAVQWYAVPLVYGIFRGGVLDSGGAPMSSLNKVEHVRIARAALQMPQEVTLKSWIQRRLHGDC